MRHSGRYALGLVPFLLMITFFSPAVSLDIPPDQQADLLVKILGYNRTLLNKNTTSVRVGIIYCEDKLSVETYQRLDESFYKLVLDDRKIGTKKLIFSGIAIKSESYLENTASVLNVDVFVVTPGNDKNLLTIARVAEKLGILTFSAIKEYVAMGLASGLEVKDGKPKIIINLPLAKAQGANFKAELLSIASVIE
ncbi:hypothetical protein A2V82_04345 [candidate division KSB1 bacterium RBG_16_48_16]|nr:MAG: hypothetical protein A2V82_04345 [candidate division KSB1 bacterium RBG_16_48_16]